jgi:uncharacterized C2H2 Zn-finger protein
MYLTHSLYCIEHTIYMTKITDNGITAYKCDDCDKIFKKKYNYGRHIERAYPCKPSTINVIYECPHCDKIYSTNSNLNRHYDKCNQKKIYDENERKTVRHSEVILNRLDILDDKLYTIDNKIESDYELTTDSFDKGDQSRNLLFDRILKLERKFKNITDNYDIPGLNINVKRDFEYYINYDNTHFNDLITNYHDKHAIYIGYIGVHNHEHLFKFGRSYRALEREYNEHAHSFETFKTIHIIECIDKEKVELLFKKELIKRELLRNKKFKDRNHTELFAVTIDYKIEDIINILHKLVDNNKNPNGTEGSSTDENVLKLQHQILLGQIRLEELKLESK